MPRNSSLMSRSSRRRRMGKCLLLQIHTIEFILDHMATIRKTISLPAHVAKRLDTEARRRKTSVSAIVTELVQSRPASLPYAALIDDDQELSQDVERILARLGT